MSRHRVLRAAVVALAFALPGAVVAPGVAVAARSSAAIVRFAASDIDVPNPGRGFYHYTETHLTGDPDAYRPLSAARMAAQRAQDGTTLYFRYFYLDGYHDRTTIDSRDLALVRADFQAARMAGVKLIVRFAYSEWSSRDAPLYRVSAHIRQLARLLNENAAVVAAVQAGFIGRWGEWYYTDNFAGDPARPWVLTEADWRARGAVLRTLLDTTSPAIPVQVRYPAIKQRLLSDAADPRAARVGIHNDCFLASADDYGTFTSDADRQWLAAQSRSVLVGGETCGVNPPRSEWASATSELARYHLTYLNADFDRAVLSSWGTAGLAEAKRRLGYRIRLTEVAAPSTLRPGAVGTVRIRLVNVGYAAPVANRPVQLVLKTRMKRVKFVVPADLRTWTPGRTIDLYATITAPTAAADYRLYLNLPDPDRSLRSTMPLISGEATNSAYAIRFANDGIWDAKHGWNSLNSTLAVKS
ncbi:DUF4832 domain-containing protein [Jidongwangia harbinensis]|uniref:DUF4832 domain-containing protein n=1 Tax=Jidongwangia harbinensis TaxID=2878561 RepID=UPI001CD95FBE|nr:DUF4832 domain-containing protein [Jidongwangia harbinensis]MCA2215464.1 DUF4832 domain-containing protein [Jidongwangia harbinensis]